MIEPLFDFDSGEFVFAPGGNVRLVTGLEELKNQIRKIIHTPLGKYKIYSGSSWGTRLEELFVGKTLPREYLKAEAERCIREAISTLYGVERIDSFDVSHVGSTLKITYKLYTVFGKLESEEVIKYGR